MKNRKPLPKPLPDWLHIGREVFCLPDTYLSFSGGGKIIKHSTCEVLIQPNDGSSERWYFEEELTVGKDIRVIKNNTELNLNQSLFKIAAFLKGKSV